MANRPTRKMVAGSEVFTNVFRKIPLSPSLPAWLSCDWLSGLLLVLSVLLVYQPVWYAGFIWDDEGGHVTRPELQSWTGLARIWFDLGATQQYYPLVHSIFWMEHGLWSEWPLPYHLANVVLQAFSALLLFKILRRLEVPGAWLAAAIFALHPVQVESVAWVSELKNVLSGVFYFSSALFYLKFDHAQQIRAYWFSLVLFVLGLLSKSVIATLPAALLVVFWWKRGKLSWKQDVVPLVPFFIVGICSGLLTAWVERRFVGAEAADFNFTWMEHTLIAGRVIWFYLGKLAWPTDLIFIYPHWDISQAVRWLYLYPAAALLMWAVLIWMSRRWRGPLAGFLFFVGTLFPALGFFNIYPFRYSFVADHFQYLACLGLIVPFAAGMTLLVEFIVPKKAWLPATLCAGLILILGALSWQRAWVYQSDEVLWIDTLARNPNCWMAHNNLGKVFVQKGQLDEAMAQFQMTLKIRPNYVEARNNIGGALLKKGQLDEAIDQFQKALAINPNFTEANSNLGVALLQKGQVDEAIVHCQKALAINPDYTEARYNLGNALLQKGEPDEAIAQYQKALEINPNYLEAHSNLGLILAQKKQVDDAIAEYQKALAINPNIALIHCNLGNALIQKGQVDSAIAEYRKALEIDPNYGIAHYNLGGAFLQKGQMDEAMTQFEMALKINSDAPESHIGLGAALLQKGHVEEAIVQFQEVLRLTPGNVVAQRYLAKAQAMVRQRAGQK